MFDPEERWERLAQGLFWTGVIFVALTAYGVYDGDDRWGLVMTIAPGAICFALWQLVSIRLDGLVHGDRGGPIRKIASWILIGVGGLTLIATAAIHPSRRPDPSQMPSQIRLPDDVEVIDVPASSVGIPGNGNVKTLSRKSWHRGDAH